jgi:hypothetical protein
VRPGSPLGDCSPPLIPRHDTTATQKRVFLARVFCPRLPCVCTVDASGVVVSVRSTTTQSTEDQAGVGKGLVGYSRICDEGYTRAAEGVVLDTISVSWRTVERALRLRISRYAEG